MTEAIGPGAALDRFRDHTRATQVGTVVLALIVGTYASWLGGDYGLGLGSLVGFALVASYVLVHQPTGRAVAARACYLLAVLVLATPVLLNLPLVTAPLPGLAPAGQAVLHPGVAVLALGFAIVAALLAGIGVVVDE